MELAETLNRTVKLAMDEGRAASYEEAQALFASFRLRISVSKGFAACAAAEAAVLTLLKAAPKTFLGGVAVEGALDELCTLAWYAGMSLRQVCLLMGAEPSDGRDGASVPVIYIGGGLQRRGAFCLGVSLLEGGFLLTPDETAADDADAPVEAGVAAAGAALNQAFAHVYRRDPLAGQRDVRYRLPQRGPRLDMRDAWLVGLGHLGQAFLWVTALSSRTAGLPHIKLTDFDTVSRSSLSTCLLVDANDVGRTKVDAVAGKLAALGLDVEIDAHRLQLDGPVRAAQPLVVVAVDNLALRRTLDCLHGTRVLEGGIGDGVDGFTRVQIHEFPGVRKARDVWPEADSRATEGVDISRPAYQALLRQTGDECGTTLVAGRSVATPFVGAVAGAVLAWLAGGTAIPNHSLSFDVKAL